MAQFKSRLKELLEALVVEKQAYEQEEWAKIQNTSLAEYRKEQEAVCNEGITALQYQRDAAIATKREQLYKDMKAKSDEQFSRAQQKLEEALAEFAVDETNE